MKNQEDSTQVQKNGRPTKHGQLKIQDDIKKYFNRGFTVEDVCQRTGYNRKTVSKYFSKWTEEIEKDQTRELKTREKDARRRTILCYNDLLCTEYQNRDFIEEQITSNPNQQMLVHLLSKRAESTRLIIDLRSKIDRLEATPTTEETVEKIMEQYKN